MIRGLALYYTIVLIIYIIFIQEPPKNKGLYCKKDSDVSKIEYIINSIIYIIFMFGIVFIFKKYVKLKIILALIITILVIYTIVYMLYRIIIKEKIQFDSVYSNIMLNIVLLINVWFLAISKLSVVPEQYAEILNNVIRILTFTYGSILFTLLIFEKIYKDYLNKITIKIEELNFYTTFLNYKYEKTRKASRKYIIICVLYDFIRYLFIIIKETSQMYFYLTRVSIFKVSVIILKLLSSFTQNYKFTSLVLISFYIAVIVTSIYIYICILNNENTTIYTNLVSVIITVILIPIVLELIKQVNIKDRILEMKK